MNDITVTLYATLLALDELPPEQRQAAIVELRKCLDNYERAIK